MICALWFWNMVSYIKGGTQAKCCENRILGRIFGSKRDENGKWRRPNNEDLYNLYRSRNMVRLIKSRRLRWSGRLVRLEKDRYAFKVLTDEPIGKISLGESMRRREDNIRIVCKETEVNMWNLIYATQTGIIKSDPFEFRNESAGPISYRIC